MIIQILQNYPNHCWPPVVIFIGLYFISKQIKQNKQFFYEKIQHLIVAINQTTDLIRGYY